MRIPKKIPSSALALLAAGLLIAGCGTDKQESTTLKLETFTSPKGNIGCIADSTMVRCDIAKHSWNVKPDPKCQLDYGNGLAVADKHGYVVCAGDTTMNNGPSVPAGNINLVSPFECQTNEAGDGMHCENVNTGHGFDLSPESYSTF
ncbi:MAG: hypothetical protein KDB54_08520 [Solirubrobacterales bacterium]|nr:hypothetical protein [Solirubrobacterales bacterium]HRV59064.1 hypothetical protein [Solirubrobacterales bacterium]